MLLQEYCERYHLDIELLKSYAKNGLLQGRKCKDGMFDYSEMDLCRAAQFSSLTKAGMDMETLKQFAVLLETGKSTQEEQIRLLRKCRYDLLEEIHSKQQLLDRLDYYIGEIRKA